MVRLLHFYPQSVGGRILELIGTENPFRLNEFSHSRHPITLPISRRTMSDAWEPIHARCYDVL